MAAKTITLTTPVELHGRPITVVILREPTGANYLDLGEPFALVGIKGGGVFRAEKEDVIRSYLGVCVDHDAGDHLVRMMSFRDARALVRALLDFFTESDQGISAS